MSALDLDPEVLKDLRWTSFWNEIKARVYQEVNQTRKVRPLLPLSGFDADPGAIPDYTVQHDRLKGDPGDSPLLHIPEQKRLVSMQISCEFQLSPEQLGNRDIALLLVTAAANRVGLAEDAILLHGKHLLHGPPGVRIGDVVGFGSLGVEIGILDPEADYLLDPLPHQLDSRTQASWVDGSATDRGPAGSGEKAPVVSAYIPEHLLPDVGDHHTVLESILNGLRELRVRGHHGEYCAVVAPDLYEEAFTPRRISAASATLQDDYTEAPIYQIRPLLREGGFTYSSMACPGTGVLFSLGGGAISLAVPEEAHVTFVRKHRGMVLNVTERFLLLISKPGAAVTLSPSRQTKLQLWLRTEEASKNLAYARLQWEIEEELLQVTRATLKQGIKVEAETHITSQIRSKESKLQLQTAGGRLFTGVRSRLDLITQPVGITLPDPPEPSEPLA